eukprot:TRINITY_DN46916_c0_g1_i1.p1 TRINITY_DN46916_c0_g1~~TRINITY_DN46916_c0_g1_i1.p1  ORF type:complete len:226 (+),score=61.41 TRINITY_DN46916_c0_g1_i1:151-828(+)
MSTFIKNGPVERKVNSGMQPPCEPARMRQRLKQIAIGKSTDGYANYRRCVPMEKRDESIHLDTPRASPESNLRLSKREFESELRAWRKFLHKYDDVNPDAAGLPGLKIGDQAESTTACDSNESVSSETYDSTEDWQTGRLPDYPQYPQDYPYPHYDYHAQYDYYGYPYGYTDGGYYYPEAEPVDDFPCEPEMPPLVPAPPNPASLVEGTPSTNLEAITAQLIALG